MSKMKLSRHMCIIKILEVNVGEYDRESREEDNIEDDGEEIRSHEEGG